jgi:hypothetical protein
MSLIIPAITIMTERVTMLGISRWTDRDGSYRTVQRLFQTIIPFSIIDANLRQRCGSIESGLKYRIIRIPSINTHSSGGASLAILPIAS